MPAPFIPDITFSDDAVDSAAHVINALCGYTVDLEIPNNTGYPCQEVSIVRVDDDLDVVVAATDEIGAPIGDATWAVPLNLIKKVKVL